MGQKFRCAVAGLGAFFLALPGARADSEGAQSVADLGRVYYGRYCQVCHGAAGKGDGPYANALEVAPTDLTTIAKRRGGSFSEASISELIDGRHSPRAHGPQEMPIWGRQFGSALPAGPHRDRAVRAQVYVLIEYLRSIQQGVSEATSDGDALAGVGWRLFLQRCASCHGFDGRGDGYLAPLLVQAPADLTTIAARRGSSFSELEVAEWIDGRRGRRAHGSDEMPVWGERLGEFLPPSQGRGAAIRGEIQLLVAYLRSIQRSPSAAE